MSNKVVFFLNGEKIDITDEDSPGLRPDTTLLNWLRQHQKLNGTKEGCAEGDCGACSVVIGRLAADNTPHWHAVNACILFLPMLHGSVVTTVEGVAHPDGSLHPVQQSMVDYHGAQCGFCTPGFVMSLYAGWCAGINFTTAEIETLLSGNLCRCTGYGPIVRAGQALADAVRPQWAVDRLQRDLTNLRDMHAEHSHQTLDLQFDGQRFTAPATTEALQNLYAENPDAQILSGATDIGLWVTKQHRQLPHLIHIGGIAELDRIEKSGTHITIGAGGRKCDAPFTNKEPEEWIKARDASMYGYGRITIHNETHAEWRWIPIAPSELHDFNQVRGEDDLKLPSLNHDKVMIENQHFRRLRKLQKEQKENASGDQ